MPKDGGYRSQIHATRRGFMAFASGAALASCVGAGPANSPTRSLRRLVGSHPVIDVHAHLVAPAWFGAKPKPAPQFTQTELARQLADNPYIPVPDPEGIATRDYDRLTRFEAARLDGSIEASADFLVSEMDAAGIDIAVNNCMDEVNRPFGRTYTVPIEKVLDDIGLVAARHPGRLVNFFGIDPRRGAEGLGLLRKAVEEYGCCGMGEWLTHRWKVYPNDRAVAYPYLALCAELQIPFGNNGSGIEPTQAPGVFADILRDFPSLKVVHQAAGLLTDKERAAAPELADLPYRLLDLAERHDNFWLDIDDWQRLDDPGRLRLARFLRRAFDGPAAERIMFGSDFPVFTRPISAAEFVDSIVNDSVRLGVHLRDDELVRLFSTNALALLNGPRAPAFIRDAARRAA